MSEFSFMQPDKSSSHMQSKTAYFSFKRFIYSIFWQFPQDSHKLTKTACYHYFHCGCLTRYIEFSQHQGNKTDNDAELRKVWLNAFVNKQLFSARLRGVNLPQRPTFRAVALRQSESGNIIPLSFEPLSYFVCSSYPLIIIVVFVIHRWNALFAGCQLLMTN